MKSGELVPFLGWKILIKRKLKHRTGRASVGRDLTHPPDCLDSDRLLLLPRSDSEGDVFSTSHSSSSLSPGCLHLRQNIPLCSLCLQSSTRRRSTHYWCLISGLKYHNDDEVSELHCANLCVWLSGWSFSCFHTFLLGSCLTPQHSAAPTFCAVLSPSQLPYCSYDDDCHNYGEIERRGET